MSGVSVTKRVKDNLILRDFEPVETISRSIITYIDKPDPNTITEINRKHVTIHRDKDGKVIREFEGIDMRNVYAQKPKYYKVLKRTFDIVLSILGIVVLSPVFLISAIAIKIGDGGPVIFSGQRWGKDQKLFPMYKFRTMCIDAESKTKDVLTEKDKNGMAFKIKDDPRVTKVGRLMRRSTIDELPQFINVLRGEMSLVGPRPIQTTSNLGDYYDFQRWCVKPGLTCYWQVCGRSLVPWDEWVEMDLKYINEMSLLTDIKILWYTVLAVIGMDGAM